MADEGQVLRGIDWRQTFPFIHIFRAFRIAIHPSKLVLGLALLLTVYFGGRILDKIWAVSSRAVPGEIAIYDEAKSPAEFDQARTATRKEIEAYYAAFLHEHVTIASHKIEQKDADQYAKDGSHLGDAEDWVIDDRDNVKIKSANETLAKEQDAARKDYDKSTDKDPAKLQQALDALQSEHTAAIAEIDAKTRSDLHDLQAIKGDGLFASFFGYEINHINGVVESVLANQWNKGPHNTGVLGHIYAFIAIGPIWLVSIHPLFALLFVILFLAAWSLFGGAIARIAAVHIARDEKISVRQAIKFAVGKFLSFISAPVIPLLIVLIVGLFLTVVALLGNIPFLGPILLGGAFILALIAGFVMTLVVLGTVGGFNLMYPTVAVEGSDSFDAISRSFSYIYARPWRMLFYTAVAVGYGAATYLFVKFFITLMLLLTHHFVNMGIVLQDTEGRPLFPSMWPDPAVTGRLTYSTDYSVLTMGPKIGAGLLSVWIYLIIATLGAFAISFYFSASTIIYYLMRNELDATEMDDVYLEQSDEDFGETPPVVVVAESTTVAVTPATAPPAAPPTTDAPPNAPPATST